MTKRKTVLLTIFLAGLAGCGSHSSFTGSTAAKELVWQDGDPLRPACGASLSNCKSHYTVHNLTVGTSVSVPLTQPSYPLPDPTDQYEVRTEGYDEAGNVTVSPYRSPQ